MAKEQSQTNIKDRTALREPGRWSVIFWNDDFTTMDFVVGVLTQVFLKSEQEAEQLMLAVHEKGVAVVGIYSRDMAVSRKQVADQLAKEENFPLRITLKEV